MSSLYSIGVNLVEWNDTKSGNVNVCTLRYQWSQLNQIYKIVDKIKKFVLFSTI